jgi:IclR family transcriptional regulator, KDG regulon repressor
VSTLARELGLPRNTAYELVNTLVSRNLVHLDSDGCLRLGFHLFELGSVYAQTLDLFNEARPIVRELVRASNETSHVAMLDGRHTVYLIKEEGTQSLRNLSAVGRRVPAHGTAVGKAILAFQPREETLRRLAGAHLERLTANTITDIDTLLLDLDKTVERGYSIDDEEGHIEVCCLGVPIRNDHGAVVAGLSITTHRSKMTPSRREELARLLIAARDQLSRRLGYIPSLSAGQSPWSQGLQSLDVDAALPREDERRGSGERASEHQRRRHAAASARSK